jgi:hypothetical protein
MRPLQREANLHVPGSKPRQQNREKSFDATASSSLQLRRQQHEPFREEVFASESFVTPPKRVGGPLFANETALDAWLSPRPPATASVLNSSPLDSRISRSARAQAHHSRVEFLQHQLSVVEDLDGAVVVERPTVEASEPGQELWGVVALQDPFDAARTVLVPALEDEGDDDDSDADEDFGLDNMPVRGAWDIGWDAKKAVFSEGMTASSPPCAAANTQATNPLSISFCEVSDMSDEDEIFVTSGALPQAPITNNNASSTTATVAVSSEAGEHFQSGLKPVPSVDFGTFEVSRPFEDHNEDMPLSVATSSDDENGNESMENLEQSIKRFCAPRVRKNAKRRELEPFSFAPELRRSSMSFADVMSRLIAQSEVDLPRRRRSTFAPEVTGRNRTESVFDIGTSDPSMYPQVITVAAVYFRGDVGLGSAGGALQTGACTLPCELIDAMQINMTVLTLEETARRKTFLRKMKKGTRRVLMTIVVVVVICAAVVGGLAGAKKLR